MCVFVTQQSFSLKCESVFLCAVLDMCACYLVCMCSFVSVRAFEATSVCICGNYMCMYFVQMCVSLDLCVILCVFVHACAHTAAEP